MKILISIILVGAALNVYSADLLQIDSLTVTQRFQNARKYAFSGDRGKARRECAIILKLNPDHNEARVLMGRTYAWDKMYDSARIVLKEAIRIKLGYKSAVNALIDLESWDNKNDTVLFYANYGLSFYPNDEVFLLKKAAAYIKLERFKKAKFVLRQLQQVNPMSVEAIKLRKLIKNEWADRKIALQHSYEYFDEPWERKWHCSSVEFSQGTPYGSVIPRLKIGDLIGEGESIYGNEYSLQAEIDIYPRLTKWNYGYFSYGYSFMKLFPKNRAGVEIYQKLPASFECSVGLRYLQFSSEGIYIITGSFGKYYKNYWFSLKPFITPKSYGISHSYNLSIRKYFKSGDNYFSLSLGVGSSPDDPDNNKDDIELYRHHSYKIKAGYQDIMFNKLIWKADFGYNYEEYRTDAFRHAYSINLKISYIF